MTTPVTTARRTPRSVLNGKAPTVATKPAVSRVKLSSEEFGARFEKIVDNVGLVIKGKDDVIRLCLIGMLAEGHVLFEDMPGTGKTVLARSISQTLSATTSRIQCTPDLLPADIT